jgi:hypothetical protein
MPNVKKLKVKLAEWQAAEKALRNGEEIEVNGVLLLPDAKPGQMDLDLDTAVRMVARLKKQIELGKRLLAMRPVKNHVAKTASGVVISPAAGMKIAAADLSPEEVDGIEPMGKDGELTDRDINLYVRKKAEADKKETVKAAPKAEKAGVNPISGGNAPEKPEDTEPDPALDGEAGGDGEEDGEEEGEEEGEAEIWTREELGEMTFDELRAAAKIHGIQGRSRSDLTASLVDKHKTATV